MNIDSTYLTRGSPMLTTDEANHYWCGRIFRKKVSYAFPEDHNNSQCFVFTKMSGSGSCRIHLQRYEETGKKQKEMGFIFIFIADKQD